MFRVTVKFFLKKSKVKASVMSDRDRRVDHCLFLHAVSRIPDFIDKNGRDMEKKVIEQRKQNRSPFHEPWMISEVNVLKHSRGVGIREPLRPSDQAFICKK